MKNLVWILLALLFQSSAARAQEDRLCFVQFIHPGLEHEPDSAIGRSWNVDMHRRKFLKQSGRCLSALDAKPRASKLVFWGEYEPPTARVKSSAQPVPDGPQFQFAPAPVPFHPNDPPLMNTDPFVFGDRFFYSICKQNNKRGPTAMQRLARGSVILFGSGQHRSQFVVDTVFVVAETVDWNLANYRERLKDVVPPEYFHSTLEPIAYEMKVRNLSPSQTFRLYLGATHEKPHEGMFSFFPCLPAQVGEANGFARPVLRRAGIVTDNLTQGQRLNPQPDVAAIRALWTDVARQVLDQGLCLGVQADLPKLKRP